MERHDAGENVVFLLPSKTQGQVALSTTEAGYVAQCESARDAIGYCNAREHMRYSQECATTGAQDNTAAILRAEEVPYASSTKHIDVNGHYTHEQIENGLLRWSRC